MCSSDLAPGVIWIAALLSSLLAIETIFSEDFRDGTLDEFFISNEPSFVLVFAKVLCHWLVTGFPILLASIISSLILYLPLSSLLPMICSLILGTFFMSLLGAIGALNGLPARKKALIPYNSLVFYLLDIRDQTACLLEYWKHHYT